MAEPVVAPAGRSSYLRVVISWAATFVGIAGVCVGILAVAAHYASWVSTTASRVAAFTPVLIVVGAVGAVILLLARRWVFGMVGVLVSAVGIFTQVPLYIGESSSADGDLVVMQANVYLGRADTTALADTVRDNRVDVLTVVELTPDALERIQTSELVATLPYSFTSPGPDGRGVGVFARYPITDGELLEGYRLGNIRAEIDLPGHGTHALFALHPLPPWPEEAWRWYAELDRLGEHLAAERLPLIIGADMNSTWDHSRYRDLLDVTSDTPGLIDAAERVGAGFAPTYPANSTLPPLIAIDHILTRGGPQPTSFRTVELPGSDHRGVIATVRPA
ncbi:endonuclease/exonuclease/phosphatase family protein [Gordonia sp. NPDC003376]